jgi:lipoprotein-anchoring transpeptidase ErfK/SrfK
MPAGRLDRWLPLVLVVAWIVPIALLWARWGDDPGVAAAVDPPAVETTVPAETLPPADLVGEDPAAGGACLMTVRTVRLGDTGQSVQCVEQALVAKGRLSGPADSQFDAATKAAVEELQEEAEMFVDGVVGRETGLALGVWPDEAANVVRTPPPPPGAVDLLGYPLSSVASAGADAPPLPANSGSGRRLVYERTGQRVWAVDEDERILRSWLVSGSKYDNETPGTHEVYSRSDMSTAWNGKAWLPMMVRWLQTDIGHIGFHAMPRHVEDDSPYQTEAELGTRLSGGCQRQADRDARFTWDFAQVGTKVVVI